MVSLSSQRYQQLLVVVSLAVLSLSTPVQPTTLQGWSCLPMNRLGRRQCMREGPPRYKLALMLTMHSALRNQRTSPLLKLPGEIRNRIYGYVLGNPRWYVGTCYKKRGIEGDNVEVPRLYEETTPGHYNWVASFVPPLLSVSRQIHLETWLLLYSQSTFVVGRRPRSFFLWIASLPDLARLAIISLDLGILRLPSRLQGNDIVLYIHDDFYPRTSSPRIETDQRPANSSSPRHNVFASVGDMYGKLPSLKHLYLTVYWVGLSRIVQGDHQELVITCVGNEIEGVKAKLRPELAKTFELPDVHVHVD